MAALTTALIGAGSSLLGNIFGAYSNKRTNDTNMKIAQMNNEWSARMMQKQMDYNTDMWNKQNEYNDPSNQVARLTKAGINPALALSNISTGSASGASSPSLPSPSSATMQSFKPDFSGIGNAVNAAYQLEGQRKLQDANARFLDTQSDWYAAKAAADIGKIIAETDSHTAKTYWQNVQNKYAEGFAYEGYMREMRNRQSIEVQMLNNIKQGILLDKEIASYDARLNGHLSEQLSRTLLNYAQGDLTKQQLKTEIEKMVGLKLSNKEKEAIFDYVVEKAAQDVKYKPYEVGAGALTTILGGTLGFGLGRLGKFFDKGKVIKGFRH